MRFGRHALDFCWILGVVYGTKVHEKCVWSAFPVNFLLE